MRGRGELVGSASDDGRGGGESTAACRVPGTSRQGGPQRAGESPNYLVGHRMRRVPHEPVEDLRRGGGQEPAEAPVGEFACSSGDEDKRFRLNRAMTGAPGEVGQ